MTGRGFRDSDTDTEMYEYMDTDTGTRARARTGQWTGKEACQDMDSF